MKSAKSTLTSEQAREVHRLWLMNRTVRPVGVLADDVLTKPKIPEFFPGEPDFEGLVPLRDQAVDMLIGIPAWENGAPDAGEKDIIQIEWKKSTDSTWMKLGADIEKPGPNLPGDADVPYTLPKEHFADHGTYNLRYRIRGWQSTDNSSITQNIIIDKRKPNHDGLAPDLLTFLHPEVDTDGVTQEYLDANANVVAMVVPAYEDDKPGDKVQVFIDGDVPDPEGTPAYDGRYDAVTRVVNIPGDRIKALPDGPLFISYRLFDKVGNHGFVSDPKVTDLAVKPLPNPPLAIPEIPLAQDVETLIDLDDLRLGVQVKVKRYTNWGSSDKIEVEWDGQTHTPYPVGVFPPEEMLIPLENRFLLDAYGAATTGNKSTAVKYDVVRGRKRFFSFTENIFVNFSVPGPGNPDRPNPVNPNLLKVLVRGGGATPVDNVLTADDIGLSATATVAIYTPYLAGERMWLYWGGLPDPVAFYDPDPTTPPPGGRVTFTIPWTEIEKEPGSTTVKVHYKLGLIAGGNTEFSEPEYVNVSAAVPIRLGTPTFPDHGTTEGGRPILNCKSFIGPNQHVRVQFPGNNPVLTGGESVVLTFQGYSDFAGTTPAGTPWTRTFTISAAEARDGFERQVEPYADHIQPVGPYGSVKLTYVATTTSGPITGEATIWASSFDTGGPCPINP